MSKRVKIEGLKGEPLDMSNFWENRKKQELAEQEIKRKEKEQEEERINKIECPVCKSTDKIQRIKRKSNGIMGPGHSSWITDDYLVCRSCGIHYDDVSKLK
jgi:C4-type Zn-finger protein